MTECILKDLSVLKDSLGRYKTKGLFLETNRNYKNNGDAPYTLKPYDHVFKDVEYPSAKKIYLNCEDPTEYEAALKLFGSWEQWEKLITLDWFMEHLDEWRKELEVRIRSKAMKKIIKEAGEDSSKAVSAAKFIAQGKYKQELKKRGRPSKKEVKQELEVQTNLEKEIQEDLKRLNIPNENGSSAIN